MTDKHTPGPWIAEDYTGADVPAWYVVPASHNGTIAALAGLDAEANARLIAAAPDMLALAKLVHGSFGGGLTVTFTEDDAEQFAAAIAKAESRS